MNSTSLTVFGDGVQDVIRRGVSIPKAILDVVDIGYESIKGGHDSNVVKMALDYYKVFKLV